MNKNETMYVREAKYGILAALNAIEMQGDNNPYVTGVLNIAIADLRRALGEGE